MGEWVNGRMGRTKRRGGNGMETGFVKLPRALRFILFSHVTHSVHSRPIYRFGIYRFR
jgi:hypothetical protein